MKRLHKIGKLGIVAILVSGIAFLTPKLSFSQDKYPEKPITLIYGWGAGGMQDVTTRLLTEIASKMGGEVIL